MAIDLEVALSAEPTVREASWTDRDVMLYQLGLGAGVNALDPAELTWVYEKGLKVLPTFAMVAGQGVSAGVLPAASMSMPGIDIDLRKILHGGQSLTLHAPIPSTGAARISTRIADVWDKGKAAVIVLETAAEDLDGNPLWTTGMQIWARGEGGFGGSAGPEVVAGVPDRAPDKVLTSSTSTSQALVYRLSGDMNPLHADPSFAKMAGFDAPILHGLASYGIVCKAVVDGILDGDPTRVKNYSVRFAGSLFPGESITTSVWQDGNTLTLAATCPERENSPVLTHATMEIN
ncbi:MULTISPECIES: MaoC/PaaZ C-terminal domain-containing protein [Rhodococcus]|jgi:acyl dehydratase|uniref:MaoC/PaaZ C-terminal domain-containing protein n=2 Tax=Rhodococcus erythropolis TaxID=1833 RepID=A0AAX3V2B7_RHOER|nr:MULTISPECIES: MaoC/PaaZ C-terminal domain-containing protein [Rhodococcus]ERB50778.1 3-alpha,7-alpha,12-alpha-trihydroxy-5-beta-cholest-24-enoyl-CoA hydratase [Rhodococcus sp. P27]ATI31437.1 3-alpha,7-alpha,12-alpha-trihydroxy-5-beta-cholest-24-enoyl-CoA hydratase [Rhodococcus sp. H-CA8f]MBS2992381.1 MaoC family dehydratase N-terminal domain-containing protein [Rhodococcus erythropolis]MBY6382743.1 3-alpha,7-alpha,12-alpha-trihydroxy-5-beta-cholest-24-enoyl-CoA hydratase [Rhodococcus erythro